MDVRHSGGVRGGPLSGDFWSRIRLSKAVAKQITGSRCLPARGPVGGERTASCAPARGPVARGPVGGERRASCVPGGVRGGPLSGNFWSRIRLWEAVAKQITVSRCLPARGPVGGERTASCAPARGPVARGPVGGERTASCPPARGAVKGERTAFSMLPMRFRDSRRLEAWLKGRKRKKGRARRCFTDLFYGFRTQR